MNTFNEVIEFAIKREEDAIQGYGSMIEVAKTPGIGKLLQELQEEERKHKKLLQELTEGKVESYEPTKVIDLKISDYLEEDTLDAEMDFQQLLIFAAKKEQSAVKLYSKLIEEAESEELKKLFEFLVEQEKSHKLKLETEYEKHVLEWD
jgi:rubrerythrin